MDLADAAPRLGAALAYYTVFALAPGMILIIALAALLLGKEAAQGQIGNAGIGVAGESRILKIEAPVLVVGAALQRERRVARQAFQIC